MKKFIIAAVVASLVSTPVFAAPSHSFGQNDRGRVEQNHRPDVRRDDSRPNVRRDDNRPNVRRDDYRPNKQQVRQNWKRGDRFDARKASNYRVIGNPRAHHLNTAPRGYRWVQSGSDAVLVGIASGIIASVIANVIR